MLKMKLWMKTGEEGGDETAEDDLLKQSEHRHIPRAVSPSSVIDTLEESPRPHVCPSQLDKETVFEWFGLHLDPAKRIEFMCGLLHMCQPLELRFLGSYLEDLARKDYYVLRDFEFRAKSPSELGVLTDVIDPVVRSKLLVFLSLLGSDSRECAGILFRILSHVDPTLFYKNDDFSHPSFRDQHHPFHPSCQDGDVYVRSEQSCGLSATETATGPLGQLALLFTMASLHPAFHFHQRELVRLQLDKIELILAEERRQSQLRINAQTKQLTGPKALGTASHPPCQSRRSSWRAAQRDVLHIERIMLRSISGARRDEEYNFEVKWSDSSSSNVTKTHLELENFLLKLPKDPCTESFEKDILRLLNHGDQYESREVERNLRERFLSAPPLFRQTRKVCSFFRCDSRYSSKPACCRCTCQLGKAYKGDCSDVSSQEEDLEPYVQGHKKKHGAKSPCQSLSSAKNSQGDGRRGGHSIEVNGPAERRKKSCTLRNNQDTEQHQDGEKKSHPVTKTKSRVLTADRDKAKGKGKGVAHVTNGSLAPALSSRRKGGSSAPDTFGETSSESYSSPSSPQHRGAQSLDSGDDNNKDTDSPSDDSSQGSAPNIFFRHQADAVEADVSSVLPLSSNSHQVQMEPLCPETNTDFTHLPCMHSMSYMLPNGAADSSLPLVPPSSQSIVPDGKPSSGTLMMQMPLVPPIMPGPGIVAEPEKQELLPTFGIKPLGLHTPGSPGVQPLVQRFKTALSHSQGAADGPSGRVCTRPAAHPSHPAVSIMSPGPTSFSSALHQSLPCQHQATVSSGLTSSLPLVETSHAKHPGLALPSGLSSLYTMPPPPSSAMSAAGAPAAPGGIPPSPGQQQVAPQQQTPPPPQQQQPQIGCGICGCHNNCGSRGNNNVNSISGSQAPLFFPAHQMAAAARQVFSIPPAFFHLSSLCSNSYLTQANGAATLPPFFPTAPPPGHPSPYGPLQTHSHSHADMLGTQAAVAAAAAANYSFQQQMMPSAAFCQRVYQHVYPNSLGLLSAATLGSGGVNKKNGNVSCYNCGVSGHHAQDCNQPSTDATQQGGVRLKFAASHVSEALDNAD
ncbi:hypothetical protein LDENG_00107380 [Lucifuga dentata]|nr:hypothetical protein LDENG_00107380 [Lucifuga dentata]